jgi:hypothetical protein
MRIHIILIIDMHGAHLPTLFTGCAGLKISCLPYLSNWYVAEAALRLLRRLCSVCGNGPR